MIFVTVGTHEQQFNRLIEEIDCLKGKNIIEEDVVMQIGFSTYKPRFCQWERMLSYDEINKNMNSASIIITHGGPASFIEPLQIGKIPIVVPRKKQFGEHVNNHQLEFCRAVEDRFHNIILVEDVTDLQSYIKQYNTICDGKELMQRHNYEFVKELSFIIKKMELD